MSPLTVALTFGSGIPVSSQKGHETLLELAQRVCETRLVTGQGSAELGAAGAPGAERLLEAFEFDQPPVFRLRYRSPQLVEGQHRGDVQEGALDGRGRVPSRRLGWCRCTPAGDGRRPGALTWMSRGAAFSSPHHHPAVVWLSMAPRPAYRSAAASRPSMAR